MKISAVICVLNLIICSGAVPPEEEPNCHPHLSNIKINLSIPHITLRCSFFSTHLTWTFNGKHVTNTDLKFKLHKENITLFQPINLGYYRCSAPPCTQAFFVAPVIDKRPAPTTAAVTEHITEAVSPSKGTEEIVYFSNFTNHLVLNCSCSNSLISWFANSSLCKTFYQGKLLYSAKLPLCNQSTPSHLTLLPPFVVGRYFCIGAARTSPCQQHWKLTYCPPPVSPPPVSPFVINTEYLDSNPLLAYGGLAALILFLISNLFLVQHLYSY